MIENITSPVEVGGVDETRTLYAIKHLLRWLGILVAILALSLFALQVKDGLKLLEFPDELEQFVIAKMLIQGAHLYGDVFSHHGPLTYLIAHVYASLVSQTDFSYVRISQAVLALASCTAVAFCSVLKTTETRIWAASIYLLLLTSAWNLHELNQLTYYSLSQFFFVIVVTQFVVPFIFGESHSRCGIITAGAAAALACFSAYSNSAAAFLFFLSSSPSFFGRSGLERIRRELMLFFFGALVATTVVGAWLLKFADLKGYFVYHIYFNQHIYARYIDFRPTDFLRNFLFSFAPHELIHSFALSLFFCWLYIFVILQREADSTSRLSSRLIALVLAIGGILLTNPRGDLGDVDQGFTAVNFSLASVAVGLLFQRYIANISTRGILNALFLCAVMMALAIQINRYANPFDDKSKKEFYSYMGTMKPEQSAIYDFVRKITRKEGDLLALNFGASIYFKADRLPASGNLFYLPWQAAYNRNPKYGYKMDICGDIRTRRPAVVWFFNWRVWGRYSLDDYEPCVLSLITGGYTPLRFDSPWHIRNDLFDTAVRMVPESAFTQFDFFGFVPKIMRLSTPLGVLAPIELMISPTHSERRVALLRVGVMFETYGRQNSGEAELHLKGPDGAEFSQRFPLTALVDHKYHFFDVDSKWYTTGKIFSVTGEGVSVWESHFRSESYTCIIYEYVDHTRRYTPACPLM